MMVATQRIRGDAGLIHAVSMVEFVAVGYIHWHSAFSGHPNGSSAYPIGLECTIKEGTRATTQDRTPKEVAHAFGRRYVKDIIYGANDGIITTFAVVSGVTGAALSANIILILGIANLLADGFSMGASNYLSMRSGEEPEPGDEDADESPFRHGLATFAALLRPVSFHSSPTLHPCPSLIASVSRLCSRC
jgi:hypothetical protein